VAHIPRRRVAVAHSWRRRVAAAVTGILLTMLAAGCGSSSNSSGSGVQSSSSSGSGVQTSNPTSSASPGGPISGQQLFTTRLADDRKALDRGVLSYSPLGRPKTGATVQFEVSVTDTGKGPQLVRLTSFGGMTVDQQDVPTGGVVGVQIVTCDDLTCDSMSDLRQPVLAKGQQAIWLWNITAGTPGPALIMLRADTYDENSGLALSTEYVTIKANVVATSAYTAQEHHKKILGIATSVTGAIVTIGSVAGAIVAVGGIVGWAISRRKSNKRPSNKRPSNKRPSNKRPSNKRPSNKRKSKAKAPAQPQQPQSGPGPAPDPQHPAPNP
jgi:hypothetical protein